MRFTLKDPGSAITHFIGVVFAVIAFPILINHEAGKDTADIIGLSVFMISMLCLYSASTIYHSLDLSEKKNLVLKKIDHTMIYILIAGSYTPICISVLDGKCGTILLIVIWSIAALGAVFTLFFVKCPKWISSVIYIAMGWACIWVIPDLFRILSGFQFGLLLSGGIVYTVGGIIYAMKFNKLNEISKNFGSHEIFHLFVLGGTFCHFLFMWYTI